MGSYETMAQMRMDPELNTRIQSCVIQQAQAHPAPETPFVEAIKLNAMTITAQFVTLMTTDQIMSDAYEANGNKGIDDQMILSGVQADWAEVESLWRRQNQEVVAPSMLSSLPKGAPPMPNVPIG